MSRIDVEIIGVEKMSIGTFDEFVNLKKDEFINSKKDELLKEYKELKEKELLHKEEFERHKWKTTISDIEKKLPGDGSCAGQFVKSFITIVTGEKDIHKIAISDRAKLLKGIKTLVDYTNKEQEQW